MPTKTKTVSRKRKSLEQSLTTGDEEIFGSSSEPSLAQSSTAKGENPEQSLAQSSTATSKSSKQKQLARSSTAKSKSSKQKSLAQKSTAKGEIPTRTSITQESIDENLHEIGLLRETNSSAQKSSHEGEIPSTSSAEGNLQSKSQADLPDPELLMNEYNLRSRASEGQQKSDSKAKAAGKTTSLSPIKHFGQSDEEVFEISSDEEEESELSRKLGKDEFSDLALTTFGPNDELVASEEKNARIYDAIIQSVDRLVMRQGRKLSELLSVHRCRKEVHLTPDNVHSAHHQSECKFAINDEGDTEVQTRAVVTLIDHHGLNPLTSSSLQVLTDVIYHFSKQQSFFNREDCCIDDFLAAEAANALTRIRDFAVQLLSTKYKRALWREYFDDDIRNYLWDDWRPLFNLEESFNERMERLKEERLEKREKELAIDREQLEWQKQELEEQAKMLIEKQIPRKLQQLTENPDDVMIWDNKSQRAVPNKLLKERAAKAYDNFLFRQERRKREEAKEAKERELARREREEELHLKAEEDKRRRETADPHLDAKLKQMVAQVKGVKTSKKIRVNPPTPPRVRPILPTWSQDKEPEDEESEDDDSIKSYARVYPVQLEKSKKQDSYQERLEQFARVKSSARRKNPSASEFEKTSARKEKSSARGLEKLSASKEKLSARSRRPKKMKKFKPESTTLETMDSHTVIHLIQ